MSTQRRWHVTLVTCAAGAGLALGLGAGVATADAGTASADHAAGRTTDNSATAAPSRREAQQTQREAKRAERAADRAERVADRDTARTERAADRAERAAAGASSGTSPKISKPLSDNVSRSTGAGAAGSAPSKPAGNAVTNALAALSTSVARPTATRTPPVTVPSVDVDQYLGTWYEVGSVKQFFSVGLVNTTARYSLDPDGTIEVVNSGNYFFTKGPRSTITGTASPVDDTNAKLNVKFFGPPSAKAPGNYWIVDLDDDYRYAIVTDPTGLSGFILSRDPIVTDEQYRALKAQAKASGVRGVLTKTRQPGARRATETATTLF